MKKYLIRSGFNPTRLYTAEDFLFNSRKIIGNNSGNLMYAYGVMNALKTTEVELDYIYEVDRQMLSDKEIQFINETYDAFIIPMADAFRPQYIDQLNWYTKLINKLKIPSIVIGIGLQAAFEPDLNISYVFDDAVKGFVSAVLDHSTMLGLRGEITGKYLSKLGFKEDRDFTPIGCPSIYTYGDCFNKREKPLKNLLYEGKLLVNANVYNNYEYMDIVSEFILNTVHIIKNHYLVQQMSYEFKDLYIGNYLDDGTYCKTIFCKDDYSRMKRENRLKFFMDVPSWINFCKDFSLFVGYRFHGCVAAILSGIPYVFLPFNARTRELAEYHHLTQIKPQELKKGCNIMDYIDKLDFNSLEKHHHDNFKHYLDFLRSNHLSSIFDNKNKYNFGESPLEQNIQLAKPVSCIDFLCEKDRLHRISLVKKAADKRQGISN